MEDFSAVKFAMGYEKKMSFLVIPISQKNWKKLNKLDWTPSNVESVWIQCTIAKNSFVHMGGRHSHWKVVRGCDALKPPFSGHFFCSGDPPFQVLFQLQRPHFYFWKKKLHFKPNFCQLWLNFSSWDTNFSESLFLRPQF